MAYQAITPTRYSMDLRKLTDRKGVSLVLKLLAAVLLFIAGIVAGDKMNPDPVIEAGSDVIEHVEAEDEIPAE